MNTIASSIKGAYKRAQLCSNFVYSSVSPLREHNAAFFERLRCFCFFVGHPRSGHTLVRSVLDAHPRIVLSDELHALWYVKRGMSRERLFTAILRNEQKTAQRGSQRGEYTYAVPDQYQGTSIEIHVIGDKNGGRTCKLLHNNLGLLDRLSNTVQLPLRIIHVVRNPFDNIATQYRKSMWSMQKTIDEYFRRCDVIDAVLRRVQPAQRITIQQEAFVGRSASQIAVLCQFLGVAADDAYVEAAASIVNPFPHRARFKHTWQERDRDCISTKLQDYEFLRGYSFSEAEEYAGRQCVAAQN